MDEDRCKQIRGVYEKLGHMYRNPWTHRGISTADPVYLSTWSIFRNKKTSFISSIVVLGLEDPGTFPELVQHTRGELRGAPLERQRAIIPHIVFVNHVMKILESHNRYDKVLVYAHDSGFSQETIEGLRHFNINVVRDASLFTDDCRLVVDFRMEQGKVIDGRNMASITSCEGGAPPGAILKRCSTMEMPFAFLAWEFATCLELPSQAAPMRDAEQAWFSKLKMLFRLQSEKELRDWEAKRKQSGKQPEVAEKFVLLNEDEQRLAQLARNMMVLVVRKGR